jgi:hypothetical protein
MKKAGYPTAPLGLREAQVTTYSDNGAFWHRPRGPGLWNRGGSRKMPDAPPPPRGGRW